jgi:hypothetical protein
MASHTDACKKHTSHTNICIFAYACTGMEICGRVRLQTWESDDFTCWKAPMADSDRFSPSISLRISAKSTCFECQASVTCFISRILMITRPVMKPCRVLLGRSHRMAGERLLALFVGCEETEETVPLGLSPQALCTISNLVARSRDEIAYANACSLIGARGPLLRPWCAEWACRCPQARLRLPF